MTLCSKHCIGICKLDNENICIGCNRSIQEIKQKGIKQDRMDIIKTISRSSCPSCGKPNNCSLENGKSIQTCWCYGLSGCTVHDIEYESCLCRDCLK